jgi:hypothetical protein
VFVCHYDDAAPLWTFSPHKLVDVRNRADIARIRM